MNAWNPEIILGLARNFMECRILLTGAELNLFSHLSPAPLSTEEIADRIGADLRALTILLDALAAMGLLTKQEGKYRCVPSVSPLLSADGRGSVLPMVMHAAHLWQRWSGLTALVAGEKASTTSQEAWMRAFIQAMDVIATPLAPQVVARVDPGGARRLLDVGGASGTYTAAFLRATPEMRATLFDRPEVVDMARERLGEAGLLDRVSLVAGDFDRDPLPAGHDLAFISAIIHQNSPAQNVDLFRKVFASLDPGGRIVVRDHILKPDRTAPKSGVLFAVNMLIATPGGNSYTCEEISDALTAAGFTRVRTIQEDTRMDGLVEAFKP